MKSLLRNIILLIIAASSGTALAQDCTDPEGDIGVLRYNLNFGVLQVCTPHNWIALHSQTCPDGDRCAGPADAFTFTDLTDVTTSTQVESNIIQITGFAATGAVTITGDGSPEFRVCETIDCSTEITTWGSAEAEISGGDYLQLRLTSSASDSTLHSATVTINGTSDQWDVTTGVLTPTNCDTIGDQCDDGSFYIGLSPEDGERVYMTGAAHQGSAIRWDNAGCYRCGDGTIATSQTDGRSNTNALLAFNATGFDAVAHCETLNMIEAHGYDDWYLPAGGPGGSSSEINLIWEMIEDLGLVGGLTADFNTRYWSSSELNSGSARLQTFFDGTQGSFFKNSSGSNYLVRCVRR